MNVLNTNGMDEKHLYIEQGAVDDALYLRLQQKGVNELQLLSGKKWTNFNPHDPGVTTGNIANYVLTEVAYKLGFDLVDYLTPAQNCFVPERYGMYLPENIYPTTPVTLKDYRTLFLSCIPELDNVVVEMDGKGRYLVKYILSPFVQSADSAVKKKITETFDANRNLCEGLGDIILLESTYLYFHSEFEMMPEAVAEDVLARIYCEIFAYLNGNIHFGSYEKGPSDEPSWEEWLDGPRCKRRLISPVQQNNMEELQKKLSEIEGVKTFKTSYLAKGKEGLTGILSDFEGVYRLSIPQTANDLKVRVKVGENEIKDIDVECFKKKLEALYLLHRFSNNPPDENGEVETAEVSRKFIPKGTYRDVYRHRGMADDFPACFKLDTNQASNFAAYLSLFDFVIRRGLNELREVGNLLSVVDTGMADSSKIKVLPSLDPLGLSDKDRYRDIFRTKSQYLDWLDHLYGVDSNPKWTSGFYEETEDRVLRRRMQFLCHVPYLTRARSKACNIHAGCSVENISVLKAHLSLLFGMATDENVPVTTAPSGISFTLLDRNSMNEQLRKDLEIEPVDVGSKDFSRWKVVEPDTSSIPEEEKQKLYEELLKRLKIHLSEQIWTVLFREGIRIENYYIVPVGDDETEHTLVFLDKKNNVKQTLGRSGDKNSLKKDANLLRYFLLDQNRQSEVVYILENHLFVPSEQTVSMVFSNWSARFASPHFQAKCRQLINILLPAHLQVSVYWLCQADMKRFEPAYREWMVALEKQESSDKLKEIQAKIKQILPN